MTGYFSTSAFSALSLATFIGLALAVPSARAQPHCKTLAKGTVLTVTGRLTAADVGATGIMFYSIDHPDNLPCAMDKFDSVGFEIPGSARPRCRVGQTATVTGPSEYTNGFMGVGGIIVRPTQFSCR